MPAAKKPPKPPPKPAPPKKPPLPAWWVNIQKQVDAAKRVVKHPRQPYSPPKPPPRKPAPPKPTGPTQAQVAAARQRAAAQAARQKAAAAARARAAAIAAAERAKAAAAARAAAQKAAAAAKAKQEALAQLASARALARRIATQLAASARPKHATFAATRDAAATRRALDAKRQQAAAKAGARKPLLAAGPPAPGRKTVKPTRAPAAKTPKVGGKGTDTKRPVFFGLAEDNLIARGQRQGTKAQPPPGAPKQPPKATPTIMDTPAVKAARAARLGIPSAKPPKTQAELRIRVRRDRQAGTPLKTLKKMGLHEFAGIIGDPKTGRINTKNREDVALMQDWLRAHGYKVTDPRGVPGQSMTTALRKAFEHEQAVLRQKQAAVVKKLFYDSGVLKTGQALPSYLSSVLGMKKAPTPEQLAKRLAKGDFAADVTVRGLAKLAQDPNVAFNVARRRELEKLWHRLYPGGPTGKLGKALTPSEQAQWLQVSQHPFMDTPQAKAELRALSDATTFKDFSRRLRVYSNTEKRKATIEKLAKQGLINKDLLRKNLAELEKEERDALLGRAKKHKGGWVSHVLGGYEAVADGMRTDIVAAGIRLKHGDVVGAVKGGWNNNEDGVRDRAEEVIANMDPVTHFVFEVAVDPLNLAPGVGRAAGGAVVFGTRAAGRGAAKVAEREVFKTLEKVGIRGSLGDKGIARLGKELNRLADESYHIPALKKATLDEIMHFPGAVKVHRVAQLATRTKTAAIAGVRRKVEHAANHRFVRGANSTTKAITAPAHAPFARTQEEAKAAAGKIGETAAGGRSAPAVVGPADVHAPPADPNVFVNPADHVPEVSAIPADQLARTEAQSLAAQSESLGHLVRVAIRERVSMFSTASKVPGHLTSVGASIRATYIARARTRAIISMATQDAKAAMHHELRELAEKKGIAIRVKDGFVHQDDIARIVQHGSDEANRIRAIGEREFNATRHKAGSYRRGRSSPELEIAIRSRVREAAQLFDNSIMPMLQKALEDAAEANGSFLFGADGRWLGGLDEAQGGLRAAAKKTFEEEIDVENPLFNVALSHEQMRTIVDAEIEVRQARYKSFFTREIERGNPRHYTEATLEKKLSAIEADAQDHWVRVQEDGRTVYKDTRETIKDSSLYAGHLDDAAHINLEDTLDENGFADKLSQIGDPTTVGYEPAIHKELNELAWVAVKTHQTTFGVSQTVAADLARLETTGTAKQIEKIKARRQRLEKAVWERHLAVQNAHADVFSRQLFNEGAFYAAMAHAQSAPLRIAYRGLKAHLDFWRFVTLPLSPAWSVRNMVDNNAKAFIQGVRDPRAYILDPETVLGAAAHKSAHAVRTVFDHNINAILYVARVMDARLGTDVARRFEAIVNTFWEHSDDVIKKMLAHHDIEVPDAVVGQVRRHKLGTEDTLVGSEATSLDRKITKLEHAGVSNEFIDVASKLHKLTPDEALAQRNLVKKFADHVWDFMGNRPEDAARRRIYRDTYAKERKRLLDAGTHPVQAEREAFAAAMTKVEKVLFDYSKISVLEHNLTPIFPFIQFWRKNSAFWIKTSIEKPWVPLAVTQWEEERRRVNDDWPDWMKRYVSAREISDITSRVPGLHWVGAAIERLGLEDLMYDPLNFFSFRPLYAMFKDLNPDLPADKRGWKFIAPMVDAIESAGLGINPLFRKPLEHVGILNEKGWRSVFPQTPLAVAFTRKYISENLADFLADLDGAFADPIVESIQGLTGKGRLPHEVIAEKMDELVNMEMVNQVARGEKPDRAKAEKKVRSYYLTQAIIGTFTGIYARTASPEDIYIAKLAETNMQYPDSWDTLSDRDKMLLTARGHAKHDPHFQDYIENLAPIQAYYHAPDAAARAEILAENPEILPHVDNAWSGDPFPVSYVQNIRLANDTETVVQIDKAMRSGHFPANVRAGIKDVLVTPELTKFWAKNDTPKQVQDRMVKGQWYAHIRKLNKAYHAIPAKDFDGRREFLQAHPELARSWQENNSRADDYKLIVQAYQADLRERYFEYVEAGDWDGARQFLQDYPFTFDNIRGDRWVEDRITGRPKGFGERWGGVGGKTQHAHDYLLAKPSLDKYFAIKGKEARRKWLEAGGKDALAVLKYFDKWAKKGPLSPKAKAYLAAEPDLNFFFQNAERNPEWANTWLKSNAPGAKTVRDYLAKYGKKYVPKTQKAKDYLKAKPGLDKYFSFPNTKAGQAARRKWLESGDPKAKLAKHFFEAHPPKRGSFVEQRDESSGKNIRVWVPDLKAIQTLDYLKAKDGMEAYFAIKDKAKRAEWLQKPGKLQDAVRKYFAKYAKPGKISQKGIDYRAAKPALDYYFSLSEEKRKEWIKSDDPRAAKARAYFDKYADHSVQSAFLQSQRARQARFQFTRTQHAQDYLNSKEALDLYYGMPADARRDWLNSDDPRAKKVREYFAKYSHFWGANRQAMDYHLAQKGLDKYFAMTDKKARAKWLHSGDPDANLVLYYFKTYSAINQAEKGVARGPFVRRFDQHRRADHPNVGRHFRSSRDPRLRARLDFWTTYFQLSPAQRMSYLSKHAKDAGVFVYGVLGDQERHDKEVDAKGKGEATRAWSFRPFLKLYYSLKDPYDRELLRRANPELNAYLNSIPVHATGDARLDGLLQHYFMLPYGSDLRSSYLVAHPEIQQYFDSRPEPDGGTAIRELLNVYFALPSSREKQDFLGAHPEVNDYFDARKAAHDTFESQAEAFDAIDPRLAPFRDAAALDIGGAGARMRYKLALQGAKKHTPGTLARRQSRQPIFGP